MGDRQEHSLEIATGVLADVHQQLSNLSQASEDYRTLLDDMNQTGNVHIADVQAIQERLDGISAYQQDLKHNLDHLTKHLEERANNDEAQQQQWKELLESRPKPDPYDEDVGRTKADLGDTTMLIGGIGDLTGNARVRNTATQVQGVDRIVGAMTPLSVKFGRSLWGSSKATKAESTPVSTPRPRHSVEQRNYKPPPPVTTLPPPRRNTNCVPPSQLQSRIQSRQTTPPRPPLPSRSIEVSQYAQPKVSSPRSDFPSQGLSKSSVVSIKPNGPALPSRPCSTQAAALASSHTLTVTPSPPPLPPRACSAPSTVRLAGSTTIRTPPIKPQHLTSASFSLPGESNDKTSVVTRVTSAPSPPPARSAHLAELVKALESRQAPQSQKVRGT